MSATNDKVTKGQHGGSRPGAGRPPITGETLKMRSYRLNDAEHEAVKALIKQLRQAVTGGDHD